MSERYNPNEFEVNGTKELNDKAEKDINKLENFGIKSILHKPINMNSILTEIQKHEVIINENLLENLLKQIFLNWFIINHLIRFFF